MLDSNLALWLSPYVLGLVGLCVGSFLNVVIHRLPRMMDRAWRIESAEFLGVKLDPGPEVSLSAPRSRCPSCGHAIAWHENIPVLSYLRLRGRCSACSAPIGVRYPAIELLTAALFVACSFKFGATPSVLLWCGFVAILVALAFIDADTQLLPDNLTLPLLWAGILFALLGWTGTDLASSVLGAILGYLSLWSVYHAYRLIRGKEGMGYGDFKLLAALGAWMGWTALPSIILLSSVVGAVVGIGLILARRQGREVPMPFGPYLAGGGVAALFFGSTLIHLWFPGG